MEELINAFHFADIVSSLPSASIPIFLTLALSFLIGLEREEHVYNRYYIFGGVRTFPIIGLCGYLMARLSDGNILFVGLGAAILGSFLWLSYKKKVDQTASAGMTSEISGVFTFLLGALIFRGALWEATALAVIVLLLLELKVDLESLARKIPSEEVFTFTRFLLISAVILPMVPNKELTPIPINPFRIWLIVVTISTLSYGAYLMEKIFGGKRSLLLTAALGGVYSSTSTTFVLAKKSKVSTDPSLFSGAIVVASGFMYYRLVILLMLFNVELGSLLMGPFLILGSIFVAIGLLWMRLERKEDGFIETDSFTPRNPLELQAAMLFAGLFFGMGLLTIWALKHFGSGGMMGLSVISGFADVDPFVMSLTQSSGSIVTPSLAVKGVVIATASNNIMKGVYAGIFGAPAFRVKNISVMVALSLISALVLVFIN